MAATIRASFGIEPELIEGHGGIYELIINGETAYTNKSRCGGFPTDEEIFAEIRKFKDPLPKEGTDTPVADKGIAAPNCCLPQNGCC